MILLSLKIKHYNFESYYYIETVFQTTAFAIHKIERNNSEKRPKPFPTLH